MENTKSTLACSSKGSFSWNLYNIISAARAGIWSSEQPSGLLHLLLHDLFLCFNSSPAFSDFWHRGWWHLAHTLPQMQWFNFCISTSFKRDFVLPVSTAVRQQSWRVLQMAAYLTCLTSPHARSLFLFSWVPSCSRLSLSNCLCWGTLWRKLIAWIIYTYTWWVLSKRPHFSMDGVRCWSNRGICNCPQNNDVFLRRKKVGIGAPLRKNRFYHILHFSTETSPMVYFNFFFCL